MTPWKRWAVLAVLPTSLLLTGCELRTHVGVDVDADGGGALAYTVAADAELRRVARRAGADPLAVLADAGAGLDGWRVVRHTAGEPHAVTLTTTFADPAELARVSGQFAQALSAPEVRPLGPFRLRLDDRTVELSGSASLVLDDAAVRDLGVRPVRAREALDDTLVLQVEARMPGEVLQTNADSRSDHRVAWTIAPGQRRTLRVVAERPWTLERLGRVLVTVEGMLALAVGIAVIFDWRRATRDRPELA